MENFTLSLIYYYYLFILLILLSSLLQNLLLVSSCQLSTLYYVTIHFVLSTDIYYHFIHKYIENSNICLSYISTKDIVVYIFY